jgi:hypothetical protein
MRTDPDDLDVLASDEVTELYSWPVALLDEIGELRELARRGGMGIEEWRRRDKELRAVGPRQYPRDQIKAAHDAALHASCLRSGRAR